MKDWLRINPDGSKTVGILDDRPVYEDATVEVEEVKPAQKKGGRPKKK